MIQVSYEGYLTEEKLVKIITEVYGVDNVITQFKSSSESLKRFKYDIKIKSENIVIEFDGDRHYNDIDTIRRDLIKDTIVDLDQSTLIRIPYFVQLTTQVFYRLFNKMGVEIIQDYPHGFIDKKAKLPSSYCSHGEIKFLKDLVKFDYIRDDIIDSLKRIEQNNEFVVGVGALKNLI